MRAVQRPAHHDLVPFGDHVFDREMQVREGRVERGHSLLILLQTVEQGRRVAQRDIGGDQFVRRLRVAMIAPFLKVAVDNVLVALNGEMLVGGTTAQQQGGQRNLEQELALHLGPGS